MSKTLGSLSVGSIVKLREDGVFVDFFVATHNYEPLLNGSGRTLLVRTDGAANDLLDGVLWNQNNDDGNAYAISYVDSWLNGAYKKKLDNGIEEILGKTRFYYTPGGGISDVSTISRSVFLLSVTELGLTATNVEGTALPIADTLRAAITSQWTRSPHATGKTYVYYVKGDEVKSSVPNGGFGIVPSLTLPEDTVVNDDGTISRNPVLADVAVGDTVQISENGALTEFYVATHNYESELNGTGRTLLVRKERITPVMVWNADNVNTYRDSDIDAWFNDDYLIRFDKHIVDAIGKTSFWYTLGNGDKTVSILQRSIFALSLAEYGLVASTSKYSNMEGTALPIAETLVDAGAQWTRTPALHATNVVISVKNSTGTSWVGAAGSSYARPAFTLPEDVSIDENNVVRVSVPPEVQSDVKNGSDLGTIDSGFALGYTVLNSTPDNLITVREYLDGVLQGTYQTDGTANLTVGCIDPVSFYKISNGKHTLTVETDNGMETSTYTVTFTKKVTSAVIRLDAAMPADDRISIVVATIVGVIPKDANVSFLVTNNGNDPEPVWEDATEAILNGESYTFINQTAAAGFAFNFELSVSRGESDEGGYISGVGGAFQ